MTTSLSPVFWQKMLAMPADVLRSTLDKHANQNMPWVIDQARCLAHNTERHGTAWQTIGAFLFDNFETIKKQTAPTAIMAFELATSCAPALEADAIAAYKSALDTIAKQDTDKALGFASIGVSSLLASTNLRDTLTGYLIKRTGPEGKYLRMLAATATEEGLGRILTQIEILAKSNEAAALKAVRTLVEYQDNMSFAQHKQAAALQKRLANDANELELMGLKIILPETSDEQLERVATPKTKKPALVN